MLPGSAVSSQDGEGVRERGRNRGREAGITSHPAACEHCEWETAAATESHSHFYRKDLLLAATCALAANNTVYVFITI